LFTFRQSLSPPFFSFAWLVECTNAHWPVKRLFSWALVFNLSPHPQRIRLTFHTSLFNSSAGLPLFSSSSLPFPTVVLVYLAFFPRVRPGSTWTVRVFFEDKHCSFRIPAVDVVSPPFCDFEVAIFVDSSLSFRHLLWT